mgnify:FL=1
MMAAKMEEEHLASEEAMFAEMMVMMADDNKRMMLHGEVPDGFTKTTRGLVGYFSLILCISSSLYGGSYSGFNRIWVCGVEVFIDGVLGLW